MTPEQLAELKKALEEIKSGGSTNAAAVKALEETIKNAEAALKKQAEEMAQFKKDADEQREELKKMTKLYLKRGTFMVGGQKRAGFVSDDAARALGAHVLAGFAKRGALTSFDDSVAKVCAEALAVEKAALTTTDIPLPTEFTQELKELQAQYGVARRVMSPYPIGRGTSKPARLGTQDDFTFPIAISAGVTEKNVKLTNASLESHKGGGLLRLPRELDEQGIIPLGQMLARYAARKFGKAEDTVAFLADGTAGYDSISGVCKIANANANEKQLGATKTAPSDATLEDWRSLRPMCATPILSTGAYFAHATWERRFRTFKTQADPFIYVQNGPGGMATLDGYPIIWTEILAPYSESANANAYIGVFGDLSYWWFGEHGSPRTDFSTDVFFTTDELAIRWLEEIDFDYSDPECAAALRLAAA